MPMPNRLRRELQAAALLGALGRWLSSHLPTADRIARLEQMAQHSLAGAR